MSPEDIASARKRWFASKDGEASDYDVACCLEEDSLIADFIAEAREWLGAAEENANLRREVEQLKRAEGFGDGTILHSLNLLERVSYEGYPEISTNTGEEWREWVVKARAEYNELRAEVARRGGGAMKPGCDMCKSPAVWTSQYGTAFCETHMSVATCYGSFNAAEVQRREDELRAEVERLTEALATSRALCDELRTSLAEARAELHAAEDVLIGDNADMRIPNEASLADAIKLVIAERDTARRELAEAKSAYHESQGWVQTWRLKAEKAEALLAEWAAKDGNSPGYNREKAATYGRLAAEYKERAEAAERERDALRAWDATSPDEPK